MKDLLRQYEWHECGYDGYPRAWHHEIQAADQSNRHPGDGPLLEPPIKDLIREQAGHRCLRCGHPYPPGIATEHPGGEWTPCDEHCTHGGPVQSDQRGDVWAQWRILTVHHLDEDKMNCRWWNLAALCQRCHLRMQRAVVMDRPYHFEHSAWFRPFAAGFYAWKYLGEDLSREETIARLDELLALEHRFTQEAIF